MKIIIFSDIHGNKYALQSLINCDDYRKADLKICLGDIITFSDASNECLDMLRKNKNVISIMGNNDSYVVNGFSDDEIKEKSKIKLEHLSYIKNSLTKESFEFVKSLSKEYVFNYKNHSFYFTHYPWESETEVMDDPTPTNLKYIEKLFENANYDYILFGHLHSHFTHKNNNKTYVCVGTLGARYKGDYVIIDINETSGKVTIEYKKIDYDYDALKEDFKCRQDYPGRELYKILDKEFLNRTDVIVNK